jgi:MFS family permease
VHHLLTAIPVPLLPMIRSEFALDYTKSGLVTSAFSLFYGLGQLPAGWLADRIGSRVLLTVSICGVAVAGLLVGLSHTYVLILVFLALMGLLGGGYHPSAPPIITSLVDPSNRGQALGFHMIGGSASFFLAPIIATAIASAWGWRVAFIVLSAPTIIYGLIFYRLLGTRTPGSESQDSRTPSDISSQEDKGRITRLIFFLILSASTAAVFMSTISFIPLYLHDRLQVPEATAGALLGVIYSAGLWFAPLAGYLSDRVGRVPMILVMGFVGGPLIYLLNWVPYGWGFFALLTAFGLIIYVRMPVSEAFIVEQTTARNRSTVLGIFYFGSMEGGGVLTPVIGYLIDRFGFSTGFTIAACFQVFMTLFCSIWLRRDRE